MWLAKTSFDLAPAETETVLLAIKRKLVQLKFSVDKSKYLCVGLESMLNIEKSRKDSTNSSYSKLKISVNQEHPNGESW